MFPVLSSKSLSLIYFMYAAVLLLSCVWLFASTFTVARQAPLSMEFFMQKYWSG